MQVACLEKRFAEFVPDSRVVALRRPGSAPVKVEGVRTFALQFAEPNTASEALAGVFEDDAVDLMIHNAAELRTGSFNELTVADFRATWDASVATAVATARAVLPGMVARGRGCLIFCGATASIRGGSGFAAFSSAKFALRGLAQSLAREYQPRGIHVAHVILDGLISGSASARRFGSEVQQVSDTQLMPAKLRGLAARSQSRTDPAGVMKSIYGPGQSASKWNPCLSIRTVEYRSGCSRTTYLGFFP